MKNTFCIFLLLICGLNSWSQPKPECSVAPLLETIRVQSAPYNNSCPYYNYGDSISSERCLVGCVATAIEQLLSFYRYPDVLQDSIKGWATKNYSIESVPKGTYIDWDDVADLSLWCGMIVRMKYSPSSSAASMWDAEEPLKRVFGYKTAKILDRSLYSYDSWHRILQNELLCGRPVAYVGYNNFMGGHAFNIDGVNEDGLYHCNWGENEHMNGYYSLEHLCEMQPYYDATDWGRMAGFSGNQYMLILHPDSVNDFLDLDTLENFAEAVRVDDVSFHREITGRHYVLTDVKLTNLTMDTLYHSYLIFLNQLTDTALLEQSKTVTVSSVKLLPGETRTQTVSGFYGGPIGEALLGISFDGATIAYSEKVDIKAGVPDNIVVTDAECDLDDNGDVCVRIKLRNNASAGVSGRLVYFRLYPQESLLSSSMDYRVLNLAAGDEVRETLYFHRLKPQTYYTLHIGEWNSAIYTLTFNTDNKNTDIEGIKGELIHDKSHLPVIFDLSGRRTKENKGIHIINGKKEYYDGRGNY